MFVKGKAAPQPVGSSGHNGNASHNVSFARQHWSLTWFNVCSNGKVLFNESHEFKLHLSPAHSIMLRKVSVFIVHADLS